MKSHFKFAYLFTFLFFSLALSASAQDLGTGFTKVKDGIYVFAPDEAFYILLLKRVGDMAAQGKSLLKMPEYADWHDQNRLGANIDAAWKVVKK